MDLLDRMRIFKKVVEAKSFTQAAKDLGMSLSVVSREIDKLEQHTTHKLLVRTTRTMSLTEVGGEYYHRVSRLLLELDDVERAMLDKKAVPEGKLKVSVATIFGHVKLMPLVPKFLKKYPKIKLEIDFNDRNVDLIGSGADVALRVGPLQDSTLMSVKLGEMEEILCASPAYLKRKGTPKKFSDLEAHDILAYVEDGGSKSPWYYKHKGQIRAKEMGNTVSVNFGLSYMDLMRAGIGLGLTYEWAVSDDLRAGRLVRILPNEWIRFYISDKTEVHLVFSKDRFHSQKISAFVDFLKAEFKL